MVTHIKQESEAIRMDRYGGVGNNHQTFGGTSVSGISARAELSKLEGKERCLFHLTQR